MEDKELEEIRRRKLEELKRRLAQKQLEEKIEEEKKKEEEALKRVILSRILTPEAKERLARVKMVKPELASALENYLIALYQAGRISGRIDDSTLKEILRKLSERSRREYRIIK